MITGVCFIFLHGWGSCASPAMQKNETHPDNRALSGVGFLKKENKRVGAGAAWSGVGALVAARRASWRVGPSPCGRPQEPYIVVTPLAGVMRVGHGAWRMQLALKPIARYNKYLTSLSTCRRLRHRKGEYIC